MGKVRAEDFQYLGPGHIRHHGQGRRPAGHRRSDFGHLYAEGRAVVRHDGGLDGVGRQRGTGDQAAVAEPLILQRETAGIVQLQREGGRIVFIRREVGHVVRDGERSAEITRCQREGDGGTRHRVGIDFRVEAIDRQRNTSARQTRRDFEVVRPGSALVQSLDVISPARAQRVER